MIIASINRLQKASRCTSALKFYKLQADTAWYISPCRACLLHAFYVAIHLPALGVTAHHALHHLRVVLNDKVLPFFETHDLPMLRILIDRGTEYCGRVDHHDYQLYLAINDIDHPKTKAMSPQTNGICEGNPPIFN